MVSALYAVLKVLLAGEVHLTCVCAPNTKGYGDGGFEGAW